MKNKDIINHLTKNNNFEYNLSKSSEELQELSLILTQFLNKPEKVNNQNIIDEIGDVKIRIKILEKLFGEDEVKDRYNLKLDKFKNYILENKYTNKI